MSVWTVPAVVLAVHDGDTVRVRADLGWHVQLDTLVRVDGIDAPELTSPAGKSARLELLKLLPVGSSCTVASKRLLGASEKYGRALADVSSADGVSAAEHMLAVGAAKPWDGKGARP